MAAQTMAATGRLATVKAPVHLPASLVITLTTAQLATAVLHTATALRMETVTIAHLAAISVTATHALHTATATAEHRVRECQTDLGKTATNLVATSQPVMTVARSVTLVTVTHAQRVQVHGLKIATQTAQTVPPAMTHASQPSVAHATRTQTRRHSSRMLFLSV